MSSRVPKRFDTFNRNLAFNTNFKLEIPGVSSVNYFINTTELPGCNIGTIEPLFKNTTTNVPGNKVQYDPLNFTFLVDEDYANYNYMRAWMHRLSSGSKPLLEELHDITLHILTSNKTEGNRVVFYGSYPSNLSSIPFESGSTEPMPLTCSCSLRFQYYDFA